MKQMPPPREPIIRLIEPSPIKINVPLTQPAIDILVSLCEMKLEEAADYRNKEVVIAIEDVLDQLEVAEEAIGTGRHANK